MQLFGTDPTDIVSPHKISPAKLINFNDEKNSQTDTQPSVVNNDDQYFLFTKVNDPEGAMLADKLIRFMSKNSSAQLNIYFVGHVTFTQIQQWAINNNIPKVMGRDDRVTLNYNSVNGFNKLHQVIQDKSIKLPVMVRVREGESHLISLLTV